MLRLVVSICSPLVVVAAAFMMEPLFPRGDWRWGVVAVICLIPVAAYRHEIRSRVSHYRHLLARLPAPIVTFGLTLDPYGAPEHTQSGAFTVDEWLDLQLPSDVGPHYFAVELPDGYELAEWIVFEGCQPFWRGTKADRQRWYASGFPARGRNPTAPCRLMVRRVG